MNKEEKILKKLTALAGRMFAEGGGEVFLYGSRATGTSQPNSDWDILIVTDDSRSTPDDFVAFALPFAEVGWLYGEQITPIHYTRSQWNAQRNEAFYHNVISSCIRL